MYRTRKRKEIVTNRNHLKQKKEKRKKLLEERGGTSSLYMFFFLSPLNNSRWIEFKLEIVAEDIMDKTD